jgi:serine/threonine protein phosphatase PrpC
MSCENVKIESTNIASGDNEMQDALIPQIAGKRPGKKARRNAARRAKKMKALEDLDTCVQPPQMTILMETSVKQLCSKQDVVVCLTIDEKEGVPMEAGDLSVDVISVLDGHGKNLVPDIVRELDFEHHFKQRITPESMQEAIISKCNEKKAESDKQTWKPSEMSYKEYASTRVSRDTINRSGTTYSAAYMHRNELSGIMKIVLEWVGDSPIFVFVNGEKVFEAVTHHANNQHDIDLMKAKGFIRGVEKSIFGFKVIADDTIVSDPGNYAIIKADNSQLACTRSLGHNGNMCIEAETATIIAKMTDEVKVIVMSDGVGDMLCMQTDMEKLKTYSAQELVDLAETRWKQTWKYNGTTTMFSANGYDDCSVAVWWQKNQL